VTTEQLRALARLAALAADQREALERADRARFDALDADRRAARDELVRLRVPEDAEQADWTVALGAELAEALAALDSPEAVDDAVRAQLDRLRATVVGLGISRPMRVRMVGTPRTPVSVLPPLAGSSMDVRR